MVTTAMKMCLLCVEAPAVVSGLEAGRTGGDSGGFQLPHQAGAWSPGASARPDPIELIGTEGRAHG